MRIPFLQNQRVDALQVPNLTPMKKTVVVMTLRTAVGKNVLYQGHKKT